MSLTCDKVTNQNLSFLNYWYRKIFLFGRCTFNRYSVIMQFANLDAGDQLCRRCTHKSYRTSKRLNISPEKSQILFVTLLSQMRDVCS